MLRKRVPELMDDPGLDQSSHVEALRGLERLNLLSTSADLLWAEIRKLEPRSGGKTLRLLDLATGGGDIPVALYKRAQHEHLPLQIVATDISPTAIEYALEHAQKQKADVQFMTLNVLEDTFPDDFDIVTTSLFTHHLDPPDVINLFKKMGEAASQVVLVNDLVRGEVPFTLVWLGTRLFSRSAIVQYDGPVSVQASFTPDEMRSMGVQAGLTGCYVKSSFPCRQLLIWKRQQ